MSRWDAQNHEKTCRVGYAERSPPKLFETDRSGERLGGQLYKRFRVYQKAL